ncbi:hypothetical protein BDW59DRAFT_148311 [Aspergillus cavernicola]|uniref:Uncharacterized protein n=1 Tax=Aspergillus cavernicola TaxID=176166 RepID=A0ABR4I960_9EURO
MNVQTDLRDTYRKLAELQQGTRPLEDHAEIFRALANLAPPDLAPVTMKCLIRSLLDEVSRKILGALVTGAACTGSGCPIKHLIKIAIEVDRAATTVLCLCIGPNNGYPIFGTPLTFRRRLSRRWKNGSLSCRLYLVSK